MTGLMALRKKYAEAYKQKGTHLTLTSLAMKAVVEMLKKHPLLNSSVDEVAEELVSKNYYHIGIAVDTDAGLIVPVVRDVDKKTVLQLSLELEDLAKKARERRVGAEELKGGSFTISNQGGIGGGHFTPIVNKPQVAILGLGKGAMKAVVRDNAVVARLMLPIALAYDHRIIDGGSAARFHSGPRAGVREFPGRGCETLTVFARERVKASAPKGCFALLNCAPCGFGRAKSEFYGSYQD